MIHFEKMTVKSIWPWVADKIYFAVIRDGVELETVINYFPTMKIWRLNYSDNEKLTDSEYNQVRKKVAFLNAEY